MKTKVDISFQITKKTFVISFFFVTFVVKYDESGFFPKEETEQTETDIFTHGDVYIAIKSFEKNLANSKNVKKDLFAITLPCS